MNLTSQIAALESADLIRIAQVEPELEYLFRHAFIQDAAYESLLKSDRKRLHQSIGEVLETLYVDRLDEFAPVLGYHFSEAGNDALAFKYFVLSGNLAMQRYANAEAAMEYTRAIAIARQDGQNSELKELFLKRGRAFELSSQHHQALAGYREMEALAKERGDKSLELAALVEILRTLSTFSTEFNPAAATAMFEPTLALAQELGERPAEAKILWCALLLHRVNPARAVSYGERSLAIARELNLEEQLAYTLHDLTFIYAGLNQIDRAMAGNLEARQFWRTLGNLPMLADNLSTSVHINSTLGHSEAARVASAEAYQISESIGNLWGQAYSIFMLDVGYFEQGEIDQALKIIHQCIDLSRRAGFLIAEVESLINMAHIYMFLGQYDKAEEYTRESMGLVKAQMGSGGWLWLTLAEITLMRGDIAQAEQIFLEGRKTTSDYSEPTNHRFSRNRTEILLALEKREYLHALELVEHVLPVFYQFEVHNMIYLVLYLKAKALIGLERDQEAYNVLQEARAAGEQVKGRRFLWEILFTLSQMERNQGNRIEAEDLRLEAQKVIQYIADHIGSLELRTAFLAQPKIQRVFQDP